MHAAHGLATAAGARPACNRQKRTVTSLPHPMSPTSKARLAGILYLVCIAAGFSAEFFVRDRLVTYADAAATAHDILAHPLLYRCGLLADLVSFTTGIMIAIIFYELFRPVSRPLARLALTFALVSNLVSIAASVMYFAPVHVLGGAPYLQAFSNPQLHSLALLLLRLYQFAFSLNLGLFSIDCLATAFLIYRSGFLPRVLGGLLAVGGMCYLFNSIVYFSPPGMLPDLFPYSYLPALLAELSLACWLTFAGINNARWYAVRAERQAADRALPGRSYQQQRQRNEDTGEQQRP
jgi:hypothetical protein